MKENLKLSIIVPVYNSEQYLRKCLDSILNQTLSDFELILVNDGSKDASGDICDEYNSRDSRVKVIHSKNQGHGGARNLALDIARGEYIGWVDSDDWIEADMFITLYNAANKYNADITECAYIEHDGNSVKITVNSDGIVSGNQEIALVEFFSSRMSPGLWNKLYKREIIGDTRFPAGRIHVDFYFNVLIVMKSLTYVRIPVAKYHYIVRDSNITNSYSHQKLREAIYLYEYTNNLASANFVKPFAKELLKKDAINRFMVRYRQVVSNMQLNKQNIYNYYIRKELGFSLFYFIITSKLPLKTKVSNFLLILNQRRLQRVLHKCIGKKAVS